LQTARPQHLTISQIITSGNVDLVTSLSLVRFLHGVPGAANVSENWPVDRGLTPLAPNWFHSRVRAQQKIHFKEFSEHIQEVTGFKALDHSAQHGEGSSVWRVLGHMAIHPTDTCGSYQLSEMFNGLCSQMPVRDGIGRALDSSHSMTKTFVQVIKPHVSGSEKTPAKMAENDLVLGGHGQAGSLRGQ